MKWCTAMLAAASLAAAQNVARPRITGAAHIAVYAGDFEKSRAFYRDFLGFAEPYSPAGRSASHDVPQDQRAPVTRELVTPRRLGKREFLRSPNLAAFAWLHLQPNRSRGLEGRPCRAMPPEVQQAHWFSEGEAVPRPPLGLPRGNAATTAYRLVCH